MKGFATLVTGSQFITAARLALGQKVLFNGTVYLLPNEFKQTCWSEGSLLTTQVKKGGTQLRWGVWSGAALGCASPPALQRGWRYFCRHVPGGLHGLTPPWGCGKHSSSHSKYSCGWDPGPSALQRGHGRAQTLRGDSEGCSKAWR